MRIVESKIQKKSLQGEKIGLYSNSFSAVAQPTLAIVSLSKLIFERNSRHNILLLLSIITMDEFEIQSSCFHEKRAMAQPNWLHHSLFLFAALCRKLKPM